MVVGVERLAIAIETTNNKSFIALFCYAFALALFSVCLVITRWA